MCSSSGVEPDELGTYFDHENGPGRAAQREEACIGETTEVADKCSPHQRPSRGVTAGDEAGPALRAGVLDVSDDRSRRGHRPG